ncbi:MAG: hypothetical protein R3D89_01765 [Sphingomonadaceae bacterium]
MQLQVEPVHQPQGAELLFGERTVEAAAHLIAELLDAGIDHLLVVLVVLVHKTSLDGLLRVIRI